jgi:cold shock CspA family protein
VQHGMLIWYDSCTGYGTILGDHGVIVTFDPEAFDGTQLAKGDRVRFERVLKHGYYTAINVGREGIALKPFAPDRTSRLIRALVELGVPPARGQTRLRPPRQKPFTDPNPMMESVHAAPKRAFITPPARHSPFMTSPIQVCLPAIGA